LALSALPAVAAAGPVDSATWESIDKTLGRTGRVFPGDVHKYGWPRADLRVSAGGVQVAPTLALGSWAALMKASPEGHLMAMGDLVLLADEVGGHGEAPQVATALRSALDTTKTPLATSTAAPPSPSPAETAAFDKVQAVLGRKGSLAGRVLQIAVPRAGKIEEDGREVPASAGMATALNFQVVESRVATTGDFVLVADEVNPVIRELEAHGIRVTALHSHMLRETPRLFFMHFWGVDDPARIAEGLKAALGKVAVQ